MIDRVRESRNPKKVIRVSLMESYGEIGRVPVNLDKIRQTCFNNMRRFRDSKLSVYNVCFANTGGDNMLEIGEKIKRRRVSLGLTQEELAARVELSKGFISQVERDLTSPSIATLTDILEALGMSLADFFSQEDTNEKVVFGADDVFVKEDEDAGHSIHWLIPNAQKNSLEPILVTLQSGGKTWEQDPHEGEEFGYVLLGGITLHIGGETFKVRKGSSFCFKPTAVHYISNDTKREAKVLWVSTPPSF